MRFLHHLISACMSLVFMACGSGLAKLLSTNANAAAIEVYQLQVQPFYSGFSKINEYIANDFGRLASTGAVCTSGLVGDFQKCIHAGLMRFASVPGQTSCSGITGEDSLGAFEWVCDDSTAVVRLVSVDFAQAKSMSDLIDFGASQFKNNLLRVYKGGSLIASSSLTAWYDNSIVSANTGGTLNTAGNEIYLITANPNTPITLSGSNLALVGQPGLVVTGSAATDENVLTVSGHFNYIETTVDASSDTTGILLSASNFSTLRNSRVTNSKSHGIEVTNSDANLLKYIWLSGNGTNGTAYNLNVAANSDYNVIDHAVVSRSLNYGIAVDGVASKVSNSTFFENTAEGLFFESANGILFNITTFNNGSYGLRIDNSSTDVSVYNVTAVNNADSGVAIYWQSDNAIVRNILGVNNVNDGLVISDVDNSTVENVVGAQNSSDAYETNTSTGHSYYGQFRFLNNGSSPCTIDTSGTPGMTGACVVTTGDGNVIKDTTNSILMNNSFLAKVASDSVNGTAGVSASATIAIGSVSDWLFFENQWRGWGNNGAGFIDATNRGKCSATCQVYDWRLSSSDTGNAGAPVVLNLNSLFNNGDAGSAITHTDSSAGTVTFLKNAVEVMYDYVGNDNGLCESNETCIYTPNAGSYQGDGAFAVQSFTDGAALSNVRLIRYSNNGH